MNDRFFQMIDGEIAIEGRFLRKSGNGFPVRQMVCCTDHMFVAFQERYNQ